MALYFVTVSIYIFTCGSQDAGLGTTGFHLLSSYNPEVLNLLTMSLVIFLDSKRLVYEAICNSQNIFKKPKSNEIQ